MQPHPWTRLVDRRELLFGILALLVFTAGCTPAPASLVGTVVDATTLAPLAGSDVVARNAGTADVVATDTTDALGAFALTPVTAGVYDVVLEHFGYAPQARANVATVAGGIVDLGAVGLTPYAPSRLYGSASSDEEFSMPLTGVRVDAHIAGTGTVIATGFSDEHGAFDLDPVPAGTYDVELSKSGYGALLVEDVVAPPAGSANVGDRKLLPTAP